MNKIWIITKRELRTFFDSLMAYIIIVAFLGFTGFFTWIYDSNIFVRGQADLGVFFAVASWTLFFFIPSITMKLIAEERRSGTIEILLTKSVSEWQIIAGKFLATVLLIFMLLLLTIPYYITISNIGNVDHGAIIMGYLGLLLLSAAYASIGIFASSVTNNQIVAFLLALFIGILFHFIFGLLSSSLEGGIASIFNYLSLQTHFDSISRGVVDSKDLIYFISIIFSSLFLSEVSLAKRNIIR